MINYIDFQRNTEEVMILKPTWDLSEAIDLCKKVEVAVSSCDYHVGLTGGCLYKEGLRKDLDLIFYKHNSPENEEVNRIEELAFQLRNLGFDITRKVHDGLWKAKYNNKTVDLFFMDRIGKYVEGNGN